MEFKINTQTKTITILQQLSVKELKELLEKFNITDDWQVNAVTNNLPSITSGSTWIQPYQVKSYSDVCSCNPKNGGSGICGCTLGNGITFTNDVSYGKNSSVTKLRADEL
jgi:hypothetical protein